ncbi:unnamed protein product [Aphanomyces euteiches]|uniref:FYVE-type domain-containing protein n=1 Tax=Aphanomyces euteiches TaxID=100861 RepID=A0A6G0WMU4_9STRA|nr:hypothetical protein Ae201684_013590 [Aphanomyces euteiches]KAH9094424.1 hypothetical protein Ae201684P_017032 [Aphanomyces euteiches]KAH9132523.1 hypothetical protein AeRB84_021096 [Aphanomyces euteiches]
MLPCGNADDCVVLLDEEQYQTWKYDLRGTIVQAMQSSPSTREYDAVFEGYKLASSKNSRTHVFKRKAVHNRPTKKSSFNEMLCVSTVDATLDDVAYTMYNADTASHRSNLAMVYENRFLDGAILNTTLTKCDQDPFQWFGVKYMKIHFDASELFGPRDATYVEYSGTTADREGHKVIFIARRTVPLNVPAAVPSVTRFEFKEWFLFTQLRDGRVEAVHWYHAFPGGNFPAFLFNNVAVKYGRFVDQLPHMCRQKWLVDHTVRLSARDAPQRQRCGACNAPIKRSSRKRQQCHSCAEAVCNKCVVRAIRALDAEAAQSMIKLVYCKKCYVIASCRSQQLQDGAVRLLDDETLKTLSPAAPCPEVKACRESVASRTSLHSDSTHSPSSYSGSPGPTTQEQGRGSEDLTAASFVRLSESLRAQKLLMNELNRQLATAHI